jgi:ankyrin repeat protein
LLVASGANANAADCAGRTPLHEAARNGHTGIAEFLIANGAEVSATAYEQPIPAPLDCTRHCETPLHEAARSGHRDVARLLLAHGADVNAERQDGSTPVMLAVWWGRRDVERLLKQARAKNGQARRKPPPDHPSLWAGPKWSQAWQSIATSRRSTWRSGRQAKAS